MLNKRERKGGESNRTKIIFNVDSTNCLLRRVRGHQAHQGDREEEQDLEVVHRHGLLQHEDAAHHSQEHVREPRMVRN